eukprot:TRINITY_DN12075_c0_g1_i1.p5 TRINITY_DN12075_c0_g1~~TRINITY_DN12075_c0_g1_i1.p5  ORF type:complete len:119 (-),score=2.02 TRINITY_DN12075_c0_g1_i1:85-441(-)
MQVYAQNNIFLISILVAVVKMYLRVLCQVGQCLSIFNLEKYPIYSFGLLFCQLLYFLFFIRIKTKNADVEFLYATLHFLSHFCPNFVWGKVALCDAGFCEYFFLFFFPQHYDVGWCAL